MSVFETYKKRRAVVEFDKSVVIPTGEIETMIARAWKVTPSKNNFMPYSIFVLGPEHQNYKDAIYQLCLSNETRIDGTDTALKYEHQDPFYANILSCSHLLVFTLRLEDKPNIFQKSAMLRGCKFEATHESTLQSGYSTASLETGMFADVLGGLAIENGYDVSHILCFERDLSYWSNMPFVTRTPLLLMPIGKAKRYKIPMASNRRPNLDRIVNFVS
jgi:hypothetical protein